METTHESLGARFAKGTTWKTPDSFGSAEREAESARSSLALVDSSASGRFEVLGEEAELLLHESLAVDACEVGRGLAMPFGHVYRLRDDRYFGSTTEATAADIVERLQVEARQRGRFVTVTDVSHGRSEFWLMGPHSRAAMSKVCGLNLGEDVFPDGAAAQSNVAKTTQLILRQDLSGVCCFVLIGPRSYGDYLWRVMTQAGKEWELIPAGTSAINMLKAGDNEEPEL